MYHSTQYNEKEKKKRKFFTDILIGHQKKRESTNQNKNSVTLPDTKIHKQKLTIFLVKKKEKKKKFKMVTY